MRWILLVLIVALAGCADTRGVNKELPMRIEQGGDGNTISMNIQLELQSDTLGESGEARISPQTSASVYGPSQASGAEALMDDVKYVIEKWLDNRSEETTVIEPEPKKEPVEPVLPDGGMDISDLEVIEPDLDNYDVVARADCDKEMHYTHSGESSGTKQKRCVFDKPGTDYGTAFLIQWSSGNTLVVPDSSNMAWDTTDYRKYQPVDPEDDSGNAGVYAGRGDNSSYAQILVKKSSASSNKPGWKHKQTVVWDGNPNPDHANRVFSRCWWTETSGSASELQRKFNFHNWDGWKRGDDVLVVFEGGPEVKVTDTQKRHYPGAAGDVKWGVPKPDDGNPCKQYPSIAAPKGSNPAWATLYYN